MQLDERSVQRLAGVHADLVRVAMRAAELSEVDFIVTEGLRTMKRQRELVAAGPSAGIRTWVCKHGRGYSQGGWAPTAGVADTRFFRCL